eukprot:comp22070_c0_seq1/m.51091 comp22070_c0_seq1/g.51091  ORF comp22070_c0_seq1/g.51091 comp22070_c0_seq1/m.51091 type:complete len:691 (-) comp22070_c0_seq1:84-2156(-)
MASRSILVVVVGLAALLACARAICPAGTFETSVSSLGDDVPLVLCQPCSPGYFSSAPGSTACSPCAPGSFAPAFNATACEQCPAGSISPRSAAKSCDLCGDAQFQPEQGKTKCESCPAGKIAIGKRDSISSCVCPDGYLAASSTSSSSSSSNTTATDCEKCPEHLTCPANESPRAADGYWLAANDRIPRKCRPASACGGGGCAAAYESTSRLCFACAKDNFKQYDSDSCSACPFDGWGWVLIGLMPVVFFILCFLILTLGRSKLVGAIYITVTFFQVTALYSEILIDWPRAMPLLFTIISAFNLNQDLFGLECSVSFATRFGLTLAHPIFFAAAFAIIYFITKLSSSLSHRSFYVPNDPHTNLAQHFVSSFSIVIVFSMLYQFRAFIDTVDCTRGENNSLFMDAYPDIKCGSIQWVAIFIPACAALLLYVVIPTIAIAIFVTRVHRDYTKLESSPFGYLALRYRSRFFYWELCIIVYKLIMVLIVKFCSLAPLVAIILTSVVAVIMLGIQIAVRPYRCKPDNNLAAFVFGFQFIISIIMFVFHFSSFSKNADDIVVAVAIIITIVTAIIGLAIAAYQVQQLRAAPRKALQNITRKGLKQKGLMNNQHQSHHRKEKELEMTPGPDSSNHTHNNNNHHAMSLDSVHSEPDAHESGRNHSISDLPPPTNLTSLKKPPPLPPLRKSESGSPVQS